MLFSIIVPIYSVEKYLSKCIESVLNQSFNDFELILVDDGSPDNSGLICDEYAKKDNRIHVIHKKNGGVSDARNAGISIAKGEFIWFLDSDDYMAETSMDSVAETIIINHNLDMLTCAHINDYSDGNAELISLPYNSSVISMDRNEFLFKLYKSNGAYWAPWKNIYRRSIIDKNGLRFSKNLICAEDCDFFMRFVRCGEKFSLLNIPVVHYRIDREDSITNTMPSGAIMSQLVVYRDNYYIFDLDNDYKNQDMKTFFANKFANSVSLLYYLTSTTDIDEVTSFIKKHKGILKDAKGLKYDVAKLVWSLLGYHKGSKILRKINPKTR